MSKRILVLAGVAATVLAVTASAHHSHSMFDQDVSVEMEGAVVAFDWSNPHSWLHIEAEGEDGVMKRWSLEMSALGTLARRGMRPSTFAPGDNVSVVVHPLKDGGPGGELLTVTLPNGETFDGL